LRGAEGIIDEVSVVVGSRIEWSDRRHDARLITWVVNPVGNVSGKAVGATKEAVRGPEATRKLGEAREKLPPPPPGTPKYADYDGPINNAVPPSPGRAHPSQATGPTLLEITHPMITRESLAQLHRLAEERQR
jgi:hypothetical protein